MEGFVGCGEERARWGVLERCRRWEELMGESVGRCGRDRGATRAAGARRGRRVMMLCLLELSRCRHLAPRMVFMVGYV